MSDSIGELDRQRFVILKHLYDQYLENPNETVSLKNLEVDNITRIAMDHASDFLKEHGLIDFVAMGPIIRISKLGVDVIEDALRKQASDGDDFRPGLYL